MENKKYINHYYCEKCDATWTDMWECCCDDKCPRCGIYIEPIYSEDVHDSKEIE